MDTRDGRRARGEVSRLAILDAAVLVVANGGLSSLTHRAVAEGAGVSHALVTYHFSTVGALRQAVFGRAINRLSGELETLLNDLRDPSDVPRMGGELALRLVTDLRAETLTTHELLLAASRNPQIRPVAQGLTDRLADLLEPIAGTRERAAAASAAFIGSVLIRMSTGADQDQDAIRAEMTRLVDLFDPRHDHDDQITPTLPT